MCSRTKVKLNKKYNRLFSLIVVMSIGMLLISGCKQQYDNAYEYPIKPGTEEWKSFQTHDEMIMACQIPDCVLNNMTTASLVETVLNYPLLLDMMAYNNIQDGFDYVATRFNGLQELLSRKDAGTELLAKYRTMDPTAIKDEWTDVEKGHYTFNFQNIEVILAQESILVNLTSAQLRDLLEECFAKSRGKQQLADIYGPFGQERIIWLIGRILQQANYSSFTKMISEDAALKNYLANGSFSNVQNVNGILSQAQQYLSER
jgi:hypothetical protein